MLYFQTKPDPVFVAILHQAIETEMKEVTRISIERDYDAWEAGYAHVSGVFTPYSALVTLERLLEASKDVIVYRLTDYHWLLVYECLKNFCAIHNDVAIEKSDGCLGVGPYRLREIDFEAIADLYFWDTDFLLISSQSEEATMYHGCTSEKAGTSIDITTGICPLPTSLKLTLVDDPVWRISDTGDYFHLSSVRYPDVSVEGRGSFEEFC